LSIIFLAKEPEEEKMSKKQRNNLIWGTILIVLGIIFLLDEAGFDAWRFLFKLWPLILIFWGASKLYYGIKAREQTAKNETSSPLVEVERLEKKDES